MSTPYRDAWRQLLCPRCADALEDLGGGIAFCTLCEGLWIARPALARIEELPWPVGNAAWWRSELPCPECAADGTTTVMQARMADDILIDHCAAHGGWFDRGELARLVHFTPAGVEATGADDFAALRARIAFAAPSPENLAERRAKLRAEHEARRAAALAYEAARATEAEREKLDAERARITEDRARLAHVAASERDRLRADAEAAARTAAEAAEKRAAAAAYRLATDRAARERAYSIRMAALRERREEASIAVGRCETAVQDAIGRLDRARGELAAVTAEIADAEAERRGS